LFHTCARLGRLPSWATGRRRPSHLRVALATANRRYLSAPEAPPFRLGSGCPCESGAHTY
jgi:hypothetical protein